ncbi:MAG: hypothetical protein ACYS47_01365 [Planctomycetota bacterium]|jgi:hypothetical protein
MDRMILVLLFVPIALAVVLGALGFGKAWIPGRDPVEDFESVMRRSYSDCFRAVTASNGDSVSFPDMTKLLDANSRAVGYEDWCDLCAKAVKADPERTQKASRRAAKEYSKKVERWVQATTKTTTPAQ